MPSPAGRDSLAELFKRGELRGFHMDHYNRGHRCARCAALLPAVRPLLAQCSVSCQMLDSQCGSQCLKTELSSC